MQLRGYPNDTFFLSSHDPLARLPLFGRQKGLVPCAKLRHVSFFKIGRPPTATQAPPLWRNKHDGLLAKQAPQLRAPRSVSPVATARRWAFSTSSRSTTSLPS